MWRQGAMTALGSAAISLEDEISDGYAFARFRRLI